MSCGCENKKRLQDLCNVRELAKKAAKLEGVVYVIYEHNGVFNFVPDGCAFVGTFVEYVWYI